MPKVLLDRLRWEVARDAAAILPEPRARKRSFGIAFSLIASIAGLLALLTNKAALAVPSFAIQTGQPCAACHIGAFGPQLTPYGRDFKLHGYVASDGKDHGLPLAVTTQASFTHTAQPQDGGAAPGFRDNDNFAIDQLSVYYAGQIAPKLGGFIELNFD